MDKEHMIRMSTKADTPRLLELRSTYISVNYGNMLTAEVLKQWQRDTVPEIGEWMIRGNYKVAVLEYDNMIEGYIVFGLDGEEGCGVILEARAEYPSDAERKRELVEFALNEMRQEGIEEVRIWLQHDNFRIRFLFESLGFHRDGTVKKDIRNGHEMAYDEYIYIIQRDDEVFDY